MGLTSGDIEKIRKLLHEESKNIFNEQYLKAVSENILQSLADKYDKAIDNQNQRLDHFKQSLDIISGDYDRFAHWKEKLEQQLEKNEQFSRSLNIRIFGIPEEDNENLHSVIINLFHKKLKLNSISESDIKKCHRVASRNINADNSRPPAILVRFFADKVRTLVLKNRNNLKSTGIQIQEDLTQFRLRLLADAAKKFSKQHVWCSNGIVLVKCNDVVYRVETRADLEKIKVQ